jgi:HTH-type transcriptional regulator/antitoxin HigA
MAGTSTPRKTEVARTKQSAETEAPTVDLMELFGEVGRLVSRPIRTPERYEAALKAIGQLLRIPHKEDGPAGNALELLSILVEHYEEENVADLGDASPQEVVQFMAEQKGVTAGQLAEILGGRSRLSEFMNEKRELSREQIKKLRQVLGVPADLLIALCAMLVIGLP